MADEVKDLEVQDKDVLIAKIVLKGDLSDLKPREKVQYYNELCHALGLNPLTRPFDYIRLQGREVLYANKSATEQMRKRDNISVIEKTTETIKDVYVVTVKVRNNDGREDIGSGALTVSDEVSGDELANLLMKAETKAKRRATLSICGLGMIDETEIDTVSAQFVTDEELDKAKATILQAIEDNPTYVSEDYRTTTIMEVDYAVEQRDITGLENIYTEFMDAVKKEVAPEIREMSRLGFKKAADLKAKEDEEPPLPDGGQQETL